METAHLNIEDRSHYFSGDPIDIKLSNLKVDKKNWRHLDIYFINYIDDNKQYVNRTNQLYLSISKVFGYISEKNGNKFLTIHKGDAVLEKYNAVFSALKKRIASKEGKNIFFNDEYNKIKFSCNVYSVLDKLLYFPTLTVLIRYVFKKDGAFYPQVYLDDARYQI